MEKRQQAAEAKKTRDKKSTYVFKNNMIGSDEQGTNEEQLILNVRNKLHLALQPEDVLNVLLLALV